MLTREHVIERLDRTPNGGRVRTNDDARTGRGGSNPNPFDDNPWYPEDGKLRPAAVLVPLVNHGGGLTVLLTKRTEHLNNHAGQISFPGGRVDDEDDGPEHTALRETEEEVGIDRNRIEIVSHLDDYVVGTGFLVRPVVGFIEPPIDVDKHDHEVDEVFEAPLEFLIDPENVERHHREFNGRVRHFFAITYRDYYIWGATAGMLCNLAERLRGE
ncbi:MAG: CoA pyrophosphatase [Rhodospirillales bacterium]|nr:CoA pyrophosphatase [Rhodospirillales bacterium]